MSQAEQKSKQDGVNRDWKNLPESERVIALETELCKLDDAIYYETGVERSDFEENLQGHLMLG